MARIVTRSNGLREIRFDDKDGKQRTIYVARMPKRDAESVGSKIDHIVSRQITGSEPDTLISQWIADLPDKLHSKLVKFGLAATRESVAETESKMPTIKQWTDRYIASLNVKPRTKENLEISARALCVHFGAHKPIDSFTIGDAAEFRRWLEREGNERKKYTCGLATNTVRRRIGRAKQFFNAAIDKELITKNPFAKEESSVTGNPEKHKEIPAEWIEQMIRTTKCEDWKIILAFARYGGMRSHETRIQRWDHIDLPNRIMKVRSYKNHKVGVKLVIRTMPIFPELLPHLMRAKEMAPAGAEWVQTRYTHEANIGTEFDRIAARAGLVPWDEPFQNLRRTRETELMVHYPAADVTSWIGNSIRVAQSHYLMAMQSSFQRAIAEGAKIQGVTAGVCDPNPHQNPHQALQGSGSQRVTQESLSAKNTGNEYQGVLLALAEHLSAPPTGVERVRENAVFGNVTCESTPGSTPHPLLDDLAVTLRESLSEDHRDQLIRLIN